MLPISAIRLATLLAGSAACLAIAATASWRAAALGVLASAAVIATRVRFCRYGAVVLLLGLALVTVSGSG